jgi:valyl-tRNA synthetase
MPFVTEEIWQKTRSESGLLPGENPDNSESIMIADYPSSLPEYPDAENDMSHITDAVMGIRTIRGELNISPSLKLNVLIKTHSQIAENILRENVAYVRSLAKADKIEIGPDLRKPEGSATAVKSSMEIYVPLKGVLNIGAELDRLRKEIGKVDASIVSLSRKLFNDDFLQKAPQEIIEKEKAKYEELVGMKERIKESIKLLKEAEVKDET